VGCEVRGIIDADGDVYLSKPDLVQWLRLNRNAIGRDVDERSAEVVQALLESMLKMGPPPGAK
jgi:hypothetical protein